MFKLPKNKFIHDEEGSGLIIALMTLMVLSVLGVTLGTITISGYKMSDTNRDSSSAYYIAEAGANMAYEEIHQIVVESYENETVKTKDNFFALLNHHIKKEFKLYKSQFSPQLGHQPEAKITVDSKVEGETITYTIVSEANIGNHARTAQKKVTVNWVDKNQGSISWPKLPEKAAIIVKESIIENDSASTTGNIYLDKNHIKTVNYNNKDHKGKLIKEVIDWDVYHNLVNHFPEYVPIPDFEKPTKISQLNLSNESKNYTAQKSTEYSSVTLSNTSYLNLKLLDNFTKIGTLQLNNSSKANLELNSKYAYIDHLTLNNSTELTIDTKNQDVYIYLKSLSLNNSTELKILGTGSVTFYISESISLNNSSGLNEEGKSEQLNIFYAGANYLNINNSGVMNGTVFVKNAPFQINNSGVFNGLILAGSQGISFNNSGELNGVLISPYAHIDMNNSSETNGSVVTKSITKNNRTSNSYINHDLDKYLGVLGWTNTPDTAYDSESIINATPTTESR